VLLAVVAGGGWWWLQNGGDAAQLKYRTAKVDRGALSSTVAASGTLNAVKTVAVSSQISGQLKEVLVDFNSEVKPGQVLARIDPESYQLRINQARADLDAVRSTALVQQNMVTSQKIELGKAKIALVDAERDFQRKKDLIARGFISPSELEKADTVFRTAREQVALVEQGIRTQESQVASAQANVRQREVVLQSAQVDLEKTTIRAPVNGVVIARKIEPGSTVAASLSAPDLFIIAQDLRAMQVETSIDEADIGRLKPGQSATFTVDAFPRRNFSGKVTQIRKAAQVIQNVVTYVVTISAENPDLALVPGMTANTRITVDSRDNVLKVSNAALRFKPQGEGGAPAGKSGDAAAAPAGAAAGAAAQATQFRDRLIADLKPDDAQKARFDQIFTTMRTRVMGLRDVQDEGERRKASSEARNEMRREIEAALKPEQKAAWETILAETATGRTGGASTVTPGRVYVIGSDGKPQAVEIRVGLTDGTYSEVVSGSLKENDEVITGTQDAKSGAAKSAAPAGPRMVF
jgi:HlyD family secretion protein